MGPRSNSILTPTPRQSTLELHADSTRVNHTVLARFPMVTEDVMNRARRARVDCCAEAALRRLNIASFAILVVGAAAVVAQSFAALADEVPTFDLRKTCKDDVLAYQGTASGQASNTGCIR